METLRKQKTEIRVANDKKRYLTQRERRLWWLLMSAIVLSLVVGILNGLYTLGGWELIVPIMVIIDYTIYYFWSDSQVKKYEVEHIALGYYANDKKNIPQKQLRKYDQLKYNYILHVLINTVIIAVLCGGMVFAGQQSVNDSPLWLLAIVILLIGIAMVMKNQKHQINRFGKNGNKIMSW